MKIHNTVFGIIIASCLLIKAKTCTDFDKDNHILGQHTVWVHCQASDSNAPKGTVNSCYCDSPLSWDCHKACKK